MSAILQSDLEAQLNAEALESYPLQSARIIEQLDLDEAALILDKYDARIVAPVVECMAPEQAQWLLQWLDLPLATAVIARLPLPRAALLMRMMKEQRRSSLLAKLDASIRNDLTPLLDSPANSAAAIMDPRLLNLRPTMLVHEALDILRKLQQSHYRSATQARRTLLLLDDNKRIVGMVAIQDLVLAAPTDKLQDYMQRVPATVQRSATREEILAVLDEHGVSSVPVVDAEQRLLGIVRQDELAAIAREEEVGDIQAMFGVGRAEHALSPAWLSVRSRMPWLQINLFTAFAAATVVGLFENTIASYTALAVLLPVVAGQSGNTGAQALAVVMRGLTLREVGLKNWLQVLGKELRVGVLNGLGVAATTAFVIYLWSRSPGLTAIMALAMVASMAIAGIAGAAVPLVLTRLGQDPAQASSIILTTITDVAGFFSFLGIATLLIPIL